MSKSVRKPATPRGGGTRAHVKLSRLSGGEMALLEIRIPNLGDDDAQGTLLQWKKRPGDTVEKGDVLVQVETAKAVLDVPADAAGVLAEILRGEGEAVNERDTIGVIAPSPPGTTASAPPAGRSPAPAPAPSPVEPDELGYIASTAQATSSTPAAPLPQAQPPRSSTRPSAQGFGNNGAASEAAPEMAVLRLGIAGRWSSHDFARFFEAVESLYIFHVLLGMEQRDRPAAGQARPGRLLVDEGFATAGRQRLLPHEQLRVRRVLYASPGEGDFLGFGSALGHVKDAVFKFTDIFIGRRDRRTASQLKEEELRRQRMENDFREAQLREHTHTLRRLNELELEKTEEMVRAAHIANARSTLELLKLGGYTDLEARAALKAIAPALSTMENLSQRGLLVHAEIVRADAANDGEAGAEG